VPIGKIQGFGITIAVRIRVGLKKNSINVGVGDALNFGFYVTFGLFWVQAV
jgi:hypothetical protein